jgi:transcriptional activator of cad operon
MRLLDLAEHVGEVVSIDYLLDHVWNRVAVTSDSVYQAVISLRRILGDDPKQLTYVATVPRFGYRMVATVAPWEDPTIVAPDLQVSRDTEHLTSMAIHTARFAAHRRTGSLLAACATLCLGLGISTWLFLFMASSVSPSTQDQPLSFLCRRNPWRCCRFETLLRE